MSEEAQAKEKALEGERPLKPLNSPRITKETWVRVKEEYQYGEYTTLEDLAYRYGIKPANLRKTISRQGWKREVDAKNHNVTQKVAELEVNRVDSYLSEAFLRSQNYRKIIDASIKQAGSTDANGTPVLDFEDIDIISRTELRIHDLTKSALRIPDAKQIDVTSGGKTLAENLTEAIAKIRETPPAHQLTSADAAKFAEFEIVDE